MSESRVTTSNRYRGNMTKRKSVTALSVRPRRRPTKSFNEKLREMLRAKRVKQ